MILSNNNISVSNKALIMDMTLGELKSEVQSLGFERYRAEQVYEELYRQRRKSFDEMNILPSELRDKLNDRYDIAAFIDVKTRESVEVVGHSEQ